MAAEKQRLAAIQKQKIITAQSAAKTEQLALMAAGSQDAVYRENDVQLSDARVIDRTLTGELPVTELPARTTTLGTGGNPIKTARARLPHGTDEEILAYAQGLQDVNGIADPTLIPADAPLVLPEAQAAIISTAMLREQEAAIGNATFHSLNANEYIAGRLALNDQISKENWRDIRIVRGGGDNLIALGVLAENPRRPAITLNNTIFVQESFYDGWHGDLTHNAQARQILLHELTHVYQWQRSGLVGAGVVLQGIIRGPDEAYAYYHRPNTTFRTETVEGQAQIVGDYAR